MKPRPREYIYLANKGHYFIQPCSSDIRLWELSYHSFSREEALGAYFHLQECCAAAAQDLQLKKLSPRNLKMTDIRNLSSWESAAATCA